MPPSCPTAPITSSEGANFFTADTLEEVTQAVARGNRPSPPDPGSALHLPASQLPRGVNGYQPTWRTSLDPIAEGHAAVSFAGAALGGGLGVAVDHLPGLPAGEAHEVAFVAAGGEPGVGEAVPELVGVEAGEPDARAAVGDDLEQARGGHGAGAADPQGGQMGERVAGAQAEVAVESQGGLAAEGDGTRAAALAEDDRDLVVEVEVVGEHDAGGLGHPDAGVDEQPDDRGVAAVGEVATVARLQQAAELVVGQDRGWFVGELGRLHADHRAPLEFAFGDAPLEERLEAPVAVQGGGGLPALQLVGDEVADVGALDRVHS